MLRLAKKDRAHGTIKGKPEDFIVEEITANGTVLELGKSYSCADLGLEEDHNGRFSVFIMQKTSWNTQQALKAIARKFRRGVRSTGFAGTKDRNSVSVQLCSIFGIEPRSLAGMHIKDISINGAWKESNKIEMGDLLGNRFRITLRNPSGYGNIQEIVRDLDGIFPNYYGGQRFGNRGTNADIGADMLRGNFREAALRFLTDASNETNEDARIAREQLSKELDFKDALGYFPEYLKYERSMLEYLAKFPGNYANAIRKLPRPISLMFVHSVESYIFNRELEERIKSGEIEPMQNELVCGMNAYGFPDIDDVKEFDGSDRQVFPIGNIIGYDTGSVTGIEKTILDDLGLTIESFKVKGLNELGSKGTYRTLFAPFKDVKNRYSDADNSYELGFSLPAGSYATVLLNEIVE